MKFKLIVLYLYYILIAGLLLSDSCFTFAQEDGFVLKGTVYSSETGLPLNDININTNNVPVEPASTDSSGFFTVTLASKNEQIIISYPGYKTKIIPVNGRQEINVWLLAANDYSIHDEVQLVFKPLLVKDLIGSAIPARNMEIDNTSYQSVDQVLQGKIAGLNVINRSGMPGEGAYLSIRGYNSLFSSGLPLVVVDGMITRASGFPNSIINGFYQNPLADIDPNNISSVTLLKDASLTTLYGIKGGNGVLLINTHPPGAGKTTLDVSVYSGASGSPHKIPLLEESEYKSYIMEQMYNAGKSSEMIFIEYPFMEDNPEYLDYQKYINNTDWQNEIFTEGILTNAYLRVKGGDARASYSLSSGYLNQEGVIHNTSYNRFNFHFYSLAKVSQKFNIGVSLGFSSGKYNLMETGSLYQTNPIYASLIKSPNMAVFRKDEYGIDLPVKEDVLDFGFSNPKAVVDGVDATNNSSRFIGSSYFNYNITDNISAKINIGLNRDKTNENIFIPARGIAPQGDGSAERSVRDKVDQYTSLLNENRISYSNIFNFIHDFSCDIGMRIMFNRQAQDYGLGQNTATDEFRNLNAGKSDERAVGGFDEKWNWMNYFASIRYKLLDRYMISLSLSMDGSSRFGSEVNDGISFSGYPFAVLPAAGIAWRISNESFLRNMPFLDDFKIRISYGMSGTDDIGNYAARFYYVSRPYYSVSGFYLGGISNPGLKWETIKKLNTGIDLAMFKEKLMISFDIYRNITEDMITFIDLPNYYGYNSYVSNGGECRNNGIDLNAYWRIINKKFKWDINLSYSSYKNEIINLDNDPIITQFTGGEKISSVGEPFGIFYGYQSLGVFTSQAEADEANLMDKAGRRFNAGDIHFADMDDNHIINEQDKAVIGNPHPDFTGGIYNKFSYRNITISMQFFLVYGNDVFNYMRAKIEDMTGFENQSTAILNRWVKDGQDTPVPKASYNDPMGNARFSSRWIEDGSFIRLKNLTISYRYPKKLYFLTDLTVFLSGTNLITWTKYLGYDPEFSYTDGVLGQGIDYGKIPQSRSVIAGIKIGL
jgi:TonB-linked SusC/RagA family outer membrane protein